jgi:ParB family chromosome partitioning protein
MTKAKTARKPAPEQILIGSATMIPLHQLEISDDNVRQIKNGVSIEALAEDIARRSLLQSLSVRVKTDDDGNPTERYVVQAGGRRLRALQLLVKKTRLAADADIPCIVKDTGNATDDSLAENTFREALHPLDQFRAFAALREQNIPDTDIAATYGVTPAVVRARLKLAAASPVLLKAYANDDINLEVLMAFCVTDDQKRQEEVYNIVSNGREPSAYHVRQLLTETSVDASDERARFIGLETYKAAGGAIMEDLFKEDSGPWLENPELLEKLVNDKLQAVRADLLTKGYKWAQVCVGENVWDIKRNLRRIDTPSALNKDDKQLYDKLSTECEELTDKYNEDSEEAPFTAADQARLDEIETALAELDNRAPKLSKKNLARSGVLISLSDCGKLVLEYGFLKPEDFDTVKAGKISATQGDGEFDGSDDGEDEDGEAGLISVPENSASIVADKPLSDSLVRDLTSFRTVALQDALAQHFNVAFLAALHAMCAPLFCHGSYGSCVQLSHKRKYFMGVEGLEDCAAYKAIEARHDAWKERLPQSVDALWDALHSLSEADRAQLFSHCVSVTLDAVHGNHGRSSSARHTDQLARDLSLDMATAGWTTTADNYFGRISKPQIIEAVTEARGAQTASLIDHLKKPVMAKEAQRLLSETGWLPQLLRFPGDAAVKQPDRPLPKFLSGAPANDSESSPLLSEAAE